MFSDMRPCCHVHHRVGGLEDAANRLAEFEQDNHMQAIKIEKLQAELAALKAAQEWRGMESAPKDGTFVLVIDSEYGDNKGAFVARYTEAFDGRWIANSFHIPHAVNPTHWQPLPTPPQEQSHED